MKINKTNRCNYREWPIRRQLMFSFICTTVLLQLTILVVVFVNLQVMLVQTKSGVQNQVDQQSTAEFTNVAQQLAYSFQTQQFYMASQLGLFQQLFIQFQNPLNKYPGNNNYELCNAQSAISYDKYCLYVPSSVTTLYNLDQTTLQLLSKLYNYNYMLPQVMSTSLRQQIKRLVLLVSNPQQNIAIYLVYPAQQVSSYYNPLTNLDSMQLSAPYVDPMNNKDIIMSLGVGYNINDFYLQFSLEYSTITMVPLFNQLNYYISAQVAITDQSGTLVYAPQEWNTNYQQSIAKIYTFTEYSGFDVANIPIMNVTIVNKQHQQYKLVRIPMSTQYNSLELSSFIAPINNIPSYYVYLYAQYDEMINTYTVISQIADREELAIILLTMCASIFTIAIVFIFTYLIAVKISRPLTKLINTAAYMSNNATKKNITWEILNQLNTIQTENQIATLVQTFKVLVKTIDEKNKSKKSTVRKSLIQYPLNQYDPEFIHKTKNKSDINWHNDINEIEDD